MRYLHYTLEPDSPFVEVYKKLRSVDVATFSNTTYFQLSQCDPLRFFTCMSAESADASSLGCAVLFRSQKYSLVRFLPLLHSVTVVLHKKPHNYPVAITVLNLPPDPMLGLDLVRNTLCQVQTFVGSLAHIVAGNFEAPRAHCLGAFLLHQLRFHDVLQQIDGGPTRFRRGYAPDQSDYVFYRGPVMAVDSSVPSLKKPDTRHSPIFVYFFLGAIQTWSC